MEAYRREKNPESIDGLPALPFPIVTGAEAGAARARPASPDGSRNTSPACTLLLLKAINLAQAAEHRTGFTLPSNYYRLAPAGQMFVLINLERITRGVPPLVGLPLPQRRGRFGGAPSRGPALTVFPWPGQGVVPAAGRGARHGRCLGRRLGELCKLCFCGFRLVLRRRLGREGRHLELRSHERGCQRVLGPLGPVARALGGPGLPGLRRRRRLCLPSRAAGANRTISSSCGRFRSRRRSSSHGTAMCCLTFPEGWERVKARSA